jgi:hypothetical protein
MNRPRPDYRTPLSKRPADWDRWSGVRIEVVRKVVTQESAEALRLYGETFKVNA